MTGFAKTLTLSLGPCLFLVTPSLVHIVNVWGSTVETSLTSDEHKDTDDATYSIEPQGEVSLYSTVYNGFVDFERRVLLNCCVIHFCWLNMPTHNIVVSQEGEMELTGTETSIGLQVDD